MTDLFNIDQPHQPTFREHITATHALTAFEADAIELACDGLTPEQIAEQLDVGRIKMNWRLSRLRRKCGLNSHEHLISYFATERRRRWRFTHEARVQAAHPEMDVWLVKGAA